MVNLILEISDLTRDESMDYPVNKRGIPLRGAEKFYNLLGGRIIDLQSAAKLFEKTQSFDG